MTALIALGSACQKNGESEMRTASGTDPEYRDESDPLNPPKDNRSYPRGPQYPMPGSGTGVPGRQTTPGASPPGSSSEIQTR